MDVVNPRMDEKKVTLASFLDIEGAFNGISFQKLRMALEKNGVPKYLVKWITNANSNRVLNTEMIGVSKSAKAELGIAQGSNSAPFYFLIYINELVEDLNKIPNIEAFVYSDDIAIICTANDVNVAANVLEDTLKFVSQWCERNEVSVNPGKANHVAFRSADTALNIRDVIFGTEKIVWEESVKYLGVTLDTNLN